MSTKIFPVVVLCVAALLGACGDKPEATNAADVTLSDDAPAIGTDIKDVVKPAEPAVEEAEKTENAESGEGTEVSNIMWDDLIPAEYHPRVIMAEYQDQIDAIEEGSLEEAELFEKLKAKFNNAPSNDALAGKTVKIPGFVSPLDSNQEMVGEFLLVPYFGSCIHSPPPPINQTILVKPQEGKSIAMKDIYRPVWVVGDIKVEPVTTDLAQAGYQIENARLEPYKVEEEAAAN